ncbi:hypothetical protein C1646_749838 [Rhizophagus diaphanus]|nr:hypothetical protein C1646_749838 [Rhizophagus diaphanus] [Rhizophagus sp. MUCL 43196]
MKKEEEKTNDGKERMAEEIRTTLNDIRYVDEIYYYNEEEMVEQISNIPNILDLDLMFEDKSVTNKQLEIDELDNFIQKLKPLRILDIICIMFHNSLMSHNISTT